MIDLQTVQDSIRNMELNDVAYIRLKFNMVDTLTLVKSHDALNKALESGKQHFLIEP